MPADVMAAAGLTSNSTASGNCSGCDRGIGGEPAPDSATGRVHTAGGDRGQEPGLGGRSSSIWGRGRHLASATPLPTTSWLLISSRMWGFVAGVTAGSHILEPDVHSYGSGHVRQMTLATQTTQSWAPPSCPLVTRHDRLFPGMCDPAVPRHYSARGPSSTRRRSCVSRLPTYLRRRTGVPI